MKEKVRSATKDLSSRECAASVAGVAGPTPQVLQELQPTKDPSSLEGNSTQDVNTDAANVKDDVGKSSESKSSESDSKCGSSDSKCGSSDACDGDGPVSATPEPLKAHEPLKAQEPLKASLNRHEALKATPVFLNTHEPFCLVTVGVQGGGKSHTVRLSVSVFLLLYVIYY